MTRVDSDIKRNTAPVVFNHVANLELDHRHFRRDDEHDIDRPGLLLEIKRNAFKHGKKPEQRVVGFFSSSGSIGNRAWHPISIVTDHHVHHQVYVARWQPQTCCVRAVRHQHGPWVDFRHCILQQTDHAISDGSALLICRSDVRPKRPQLHAQLFIVRFAAPFGPCVGV